MSRNYKQRFAVLLVFLVFLIPVYCFPAIGGESIETTEGFIEKLEEEYAGIRDFSARLTISGLEPPLQVELRAISEPRLLRVEYLAPPEMEGQFFLLEGDYLYQFMPVQNLVIKKDLKNSKVPVKAANLTPDYLLELVRSEDLEVNLIGSPGEPFFPWNMKDVLEFKISAPWLDGEGISGSNSDGSFTTPGSLGPEADSYVLEIIPREEGFQFARQVIEFDPENYLPGELVTYFETEDKKPVRTLVKEVRTNLGLVRKEVGKLPEDAEVISD